MDKKFNKEDSLKLIEGMIAEARFKPRKMDSLLTLQWGYLVMTAALLHWYLETVARVDYAPAAWLLMLLGMITTSIIASKYRQDNKVKTYIDNLIKQVWIAFGISFVTLVFAIEPNHQYFLPVVMLLYGVAMWMQGSLLKFIPYKAGAFACWLGSAFAFGLSPEQQLIVLAGTAILGYIIPGHLLFAKISKADV
jgi:hypothetical protein